MSRGLYWVQTPYQYYSTQGRSNTSSEIKGYGLHSRDDKELSSWHVRGHNCHKPLTSGQTANNRAKSISCRNPPGVCVLGRPLQSPGYKIISRTADSDLASDGKHGRYRMLLQIEVKLNLPSMHLKGRKQLCFRQSVYFHLSYFLGKTEDDDYLPVINIWLK